MNDTEPRGRAWVWPVLLMSLLFSQVALCLVGVYLATSSRSFAVEADYYNKALHWDELLAEERASAQLHWTGDLSVSPAANALNRRTVTLALKDKAGAPVLDADVTLACFHHARAADIHQVALKPVGLGLYAADLPLNRRGLWEFRLVARHGKDLYLQTLVRDLPAPLPLAAGAHP